MEVTGGTFSSRIDTEYRIQDRGTRSSQGEVGVPCLYPWNQLYNATAELEGKVLALPSPRQVSIIALSPALKNKTFCDAPAQ